MINADMRPLELADWSLLRTMRIRAVTQHPGLFYDSAAGAMNYAPSHWQKLLTTDGNRFLGLFDDKKCAGITGIVTIAADESGQTGMVGYSYIDQEYRGNGYINLLYKTNLDHALHYQKWKKLVSDHRIDNESSRKSLLKCGFVFTEQAMIDWPDGTRDYELRYELDLEKLRLLKAQSNN